MIGSVYEFTIHRRKIRDLEHQMSSASDVAALVRRLLGQGEYREKFFVILLDQQNKVVGIHLVAIGDDCKVEVAPREVFRAAIISGALKIILAHNHPSGERAPSVMDADVTQRLQSTGSLIGIKVLDHVIVTDDGYYSFSEQNKM